MKIPPKGSAGWCASCKHKEYCKGSTAYPGSIVSRQGECHGITTYVPATTGVSKTITIKHHIYEESLK